MMLDFLGNMGAGELLIILLILTVGAAVVVSLLNEKRKNR